MNVEQFASFDKDINNISIFEEKKSKFVTLGFYVDNQEHINKILINLRKTYSEASHLTYAYKLLNEQITSKSCDDGEPSGCAGKPLLNVINQRKLYNVLIVVARIFGGVKLGAGNLTRAYSNSAISLIESNLVWYKIGWYITFRTSFELVGKLENSLRNDGIIYKLESDVFTVLTENEFDFISKFKSYIIEVINKKYEYVKQRKC